MTPGAFCSRVLAWYRRWRVASGLSTKLVGQVGEFLVCAELGRRGLIATPFAGNVPGYDVIATDVEMNSVPIQVKTCSRGTWQFSGDKLLRIEYDPGTGQQKVKGVRDKTHPELIYVFVSLGDGSEKKDRFFICTKREFLDVVRDHYAAYLEKKGGRRPRNPESRHTALLVSDLERFEDQWDIISSRLDEKRSS